MARIPLIENTASKSGNQAACQNDPETHDRNNDKNVSQAGSHESDIEAPKTESVTATVVGCSAFYTQI